MVTFNTESVVAFCLVIGLEVTLGFSSSLIYKFASYSSNVMSCHSPCACKRKALKVASDIRIINRKIHDAKFFYELCQFVRLVG